MAVFDAGRIKIIPRGEWDASYQYEVDDWVTYHNTSYLCMKPNTGIHPVDDATSEYWELTAKGAVTATTQMAGVVKPDGTTITVDPDGTIHGANTIQIDNVMSDTSTNPVQNKVVKAAVDKKADKTALNTKADNMAFDEDNSLLYLKSGNTVLSSVHIEGGGGIASIIHVDTHEDSWKGNQNVLVEIFDDTADYQGHFDASGDYFHKVNTIGDHLVRVTDENGDTFEGHVNVEQIGAVYYIYIDATQPWQEWVRAGRLSDSSYADLSAVLADETALRQLMTIHASVDYLATWIQSDADARSAFLASDKALKWIGLRDYAYDHMPSDFIADWLGGEHWERALKDHVPTMTSNSAPYGQAISSGAYSGYDAWKAFNGLKTINDIWLSANVNAGNYCGYSFVNPIKIGKVVFNGNYTDKEYSIDVYDGTNWSSIATVSGTSGVALGNDIYRYEAQVNTNIYTTQARVRITVGNGKTQSLRIQFYGRSLSVSVPTMTSMADPWGEVISTRANFTNKNDIYKAFNKNASDYGVLTGSASVNPNGASIGYKFTEKVKAKYCFIKKISWDASVTNSVKIQGSDDGNNWTDLSDAIAFAHNAEVNKMIPLADNENKYFRVAVTSSTNCYSFGIFVLDFYGENYSEREFADGSTMKYLYDHGLELEEIGLFASNSSQKAEKREDYLYTYKNGSAVGAFCYTNNTVDTTSKKLYRVIVGDYASDNSSSKDACASVYVGTSKPSSYAWNSVADAKIAVGGSNVPYNVSLDISSVNGNVYLGFGSTSSGNLIRECSIKEMWLE